MTLVEAIDQIMKRPDFIAVLEPARLIAVNAQGMLIDEGKRKPTYPRLRAQELTALTWQVFTRDQWSQRVAVIEAELRERGLLNDNG